MNKQGEGKIEYLDYTYSPITGCLHDCSYCYMKRMAARFPQVSMTPAFHPERLVEPAGVKKPSIIGVSYSGDMWGEWVPAKWIRDVLAMCHLASWHRFLFLTKNPSRYGEFDIPPNCWCGTSVTGEHIVAGDLNGRIGTLLDVRNERRFVSIEPFIGDTLPVLAFAAEWIIVGGLTGKRARVPHEALMWAVVNLCKDYGKPLFIKDNAKYEKEIKQYPEGLKI